jgi:hypothetical protein
MSQSNRRIAATKTTALRTLGALACAAALFGTVSVASAADAQGSNTPTNATPYVAPSATNAAPKHVSKAARKERHAARKAARKERRANKNAELNTLEKNGYNPASNDPKYPSNLQNAERKSQGLPAQPSGQ